MKIKLNEQKVEQLLNDLYVKLGFCLPPPLIKRIINNPPTSVERFVDVVYKGEGLEPELKSLLYQQVFQMVAATFEQREQDGENQSV